MEEKPDTTLFDEYKFLTKEEMERLNLTQYIGSSAVRAYLHGFVVRYELYKKVKLASFTHLQFIRVSLECLSIYLVLDILFPLLYLAIHLVTTGCLIS
jgi:hypothetical protein